LAYDLVVQGGMSPLDALKLVWTDVQTLGLGDDQIATGSLATAPCVERVASNEGLLWGTIVRSDRCWSGVPHACIPPQWFLEPPQGPFFLGNYLIEGKPWRPLGDLLIKLLYPESEAHTWMDEVIRLGCYRALWWTNGWARALLGELISLIHPWAMEEVWELDPSIDWDDPRRTFELPCLESVSPLQILANPARSWAADFGERGHEAFWALEDVRAYLTEGVCRRLSMHEL
jgi:hypothetical protein